MRECWPRGEALRELLPKLNGWRGREDGKRGFTGDAVLSETGDEASNISDRANEEDGFDLGRPVPNLKEGSCASGFGLVGRAVVLKHFDLEREGLSGLDFLRS